MKTLVALDLETTGLDTERDAVIEIGAVRFRGDRIDDEWSTLVNPGRPLPAFITQLTGITDEMLSGAPRLSQVLETIEAFVGDLPILGHNVGFDLAFLQRKGLFALNPKLDTFDLASALMPSAARYRLGALASLLGVPVRTSHRALEDARATQQVFARLLEKARSLPLYTLEEIVRLGGELEWGAGWIFEEVFSEAMKQVGQRGMPARRVPPAFEPPPRATPPLTTSDPPVPLDTEEVASVLEPGGPLARTFKDYEHRPQQVTMLRAVAEALSSGRHLLVEAGTGTGKSLAYLIPAFAWARQNGQRVVVSTNTINLQEQLLHKDIPDLCRTLGHDLRSAVLKGRANYLCPRRLAAMRRLGPRTADEMRVLAKVLVWLESGGSGDRGEISLTGPGEASAWSRLSADSEDCAGEACLTTTGGACPYRKARLEAEAAHVVIVNHALLLADIVTGSRVLPEYRHLVVDEAHHLEEAVTNGLSFHVTEGDVIRLLRDLGSEGHGLLGRVVAASRRSLPPEAAGRVAKAAAGAAALSQEGLELSQRFFASVATLLSHQRQDREIGPYSQQVRIVPATRTLPEWAEVEVAWENLRQPMSSILGTLGQMADALADSGSGGDGAAEDLAITLRSALRGLSEVFGSLERMIFEPDPHTVYWAEVRPVQEQVLLHAAPLEVGPLVERFLWHEKESVIMTSATLTTAGEFDYLRQRLNADEADELALGSPFDYENSTLLYLINDIPEPTERQGYQQAVERGLLRLCRATRGRTLALFTSYEQLRRTSKAIAEPLAANGILVFEQGEGASRHALLETFRTTDQAVLLGTRSFWEGVDVPGEALSVLAIIRLPFDVPTDPIVAARAETYESPFSDYSVPEAILRFRQGFGRLIRTKSDRGVVVSFDRRVLTKPYGRAFLDSLPRCTVRLGPLADLPTAAARWLGL
ncbi:MAG: helicase C-terminal domain-containing protein [Chloroflexota bacterium]